MKYQNILDKSYRHLKEGFTYRVAKEFRDYDHNLQSLGITLVFIGSNFVPYEDGLSLFVSINGIEQQIRLQCRPEEQKEIIENLEQYLVQCQ
ncbi:MAG: DUF3601 domain-containing protein [Fluviicoccus sp.]|uniref:DUF3601 domain-containing protein n=1 Tax=Fluviicoccus sp. TaxID=2003552 RepID=UPI0027174FB1|nr:DUF3601 domain-containing protein [Fluviicoccus sp.]MDO8329119.1 DUF3601 domain-containing protein [Fluviicoccus sp.]